MRDDNSNPNLGQANLAASKIGSVNAMYQGNMFRTKRGGTNTVGANVDPEAYLQPLPGAKRQRRR